MSARTPSEVATAMKTWLEASEWDRGVLGTEKAFQRVDLAYSVNISAALDRVVSSKDRLALIVPVSSAWESANRDPEYHPYQRETLQVTVLVTDRRIGSIEDLTGLLFGDAPRVNCRPVSDSMVGLQLEDTNLRVCWTIDFECLTDWN